MPRILIFCTLFTLFSARPIFSQRISANAKATNFIHIKSGEIGTVSLGTQFQGNAGCSVQINRTVSTVNEFNFSAETVFSKIYFPVKDVNISSQIFATTLHNINICNTASFESACIVATNFSANIPLFGKKIILSPFFSIGQMNAFGGKICGFKAVPEIPSFFLFGASASFPKLTIILQTGLFNISVRSEAESDINSQGFQKQFLLMCGNNITFKKISVSYRCGAFYTDGKATAQTEHGEASIFAKNKFLALGTGAQFFSESKHFFFSAGLHFIYFPIGFAKADFSYNIKLLFFAMHQKFEFTFDNANKYALLLPHCSGEIRFLKSGKLFINKIFCIPLTFSNLSNIINTPTSNKDVTQLLLTLFLSGLSFGIKI